MSNRKIVKLYTSPSIIPKKVYSPGIINFSLDINSGSRLVLCLETFAIDSATRVTLKFKTSFSVDGIFKQVLLVTSTSIGVQTSVLVDFHNFIDIQFEVAGGNATIAFGLTSNDNANVNGPESLPSHRPVKYITELLKTSGGSPDMNVIGSLASPIIFERIFINGEIAFIEKLVLKIRDSGGSALSDFGAGSALTNGLLLEIKIGGIIEISVNLKTNAELISAADNIFEITQFQGSPLLVYNFIFKESLSLNHNNDNDFVRIKIQDDLTGIQELQSAFKRWEVI